MNSADPGDQRDPDRAAIRVSARPDGSRTYAIEGSPRGLPPVARRDLDLAWQDARQAAMDGRWGVVRGFRFLWPDGRATELALADPDARCWAAAVDRRIGLDSRVGLSILLRLLALVDLLARAPWSRTLCALNPREARDGATLDARLLAAAATAELTDDAGFDEATMHARVLPGGLPPAPTRTRHGINLADTSRARAARPTNDQPPQGAGPGLAGASA